MKRKPSLHGTNSATAEIPALERSESTISSHSRFLAPPFICRAATFSVMLLLSDTRLLIVPSYHGHRYLQPPPISHATPQFGKGTHDVSARPERPVSLLTPHHLKLADALKTYQWISHTLPSRFTKQNLGFKVQTTLPGTPSLAALSSYRSTLPELVTHTELPIMWPIPLALKNLLPFFGRCSCTA